MTGLVIFVFAYEIVSIFGADETVTDLAASYLAVYALLFFVLTASDTLESGFVGWGDTRAALYINVVAVAVNIVSIRS